MTSVTFWMGINYGDCVQQMDIWQETLNGVGRWEIIADPAAGCNWPAVNTITALRNNHVELSIDGVLLMRGYVDDVLPYLDKEGYHTRLYKLTGRNRGMDLAQHQVTGRWINTRADIVIAAALGIIPSELTAVAVGPLPANIDYEAERTYLSDLVRDVADLVSYDFYVDNTNWAPNANLNFFGPGASATAVVLIDFANSATNNILGIDPCGEEVGFNIKNYVEGHAGSVQDHWTNLNAVDWTPMAGNTVTDEVGLWLNGGAAIRCTNTSGGVGGIRMDLDFSAAGGRYFHGPTGIYPLDMSEPTMASFNYLVHNTWVAPGAIKNVRIRLRDNAGTWIEYNRGIFAGLAKCFNCTDQPTNDEYRKVDFPIGDEAGIELAGPPVTSKGAWGLIGGALPFLWNNVDMIRFLTTINTNNNNYFIVDGLQLPNVEPVSIQQDAASIAAYGQRMKDYYRPDIQDQYKLDAATVDHLARLKDPKETLKVVAIGQTGTPFAAQTLSVVAPQFGIGGPLITDSEVYRILRLHHKVVKNSEESNIPGYTFTTEYDLIRNQYYGTATTQYVDHTKIINTVDPTQSILRDQRLIDRYRRQSGPRRLTP